MVIVFITFIFNTLQLAPLDYTALNIPVIFPPSNATQQFSCGMIPVAMDNVIENTEVFFITLTSSDPAVVLTPPNNTTVNILDSSSKP